MALDRAVEQTFPIQCSGRDREGNEVLPKPVDVQVRISKSVGCNTISTNVTCQYNTGGHGQRCKASHPRVDKIWEGVGCPYSLDIPYALEKKR